MYSREDQILYLQAVTLSGKEYFLFRQCNGIETAGISLSVNDYRIPAVGQRQRLLLFSRLCLCLQASVPPFTLYQLKYNVNVGWMKVEYIKSMYSIFISLLFCGITLCEQEVPLETMLCLGQRYVWTVRTYLWKVGKVVRLMLPRDQSLVSNHLVYFLVTLQQPINNGLVGLRLREVETPTAQTSFFFISRNPRLG